LVPIDFLYTISYRLSIVTFAVGRTVYSYYSFRTDEDRRTQQSRGPTNSATVTMVG